MEKSSEPFSTSRTDAKTACVICACAACGRDGDFLPTYAEQCVPECNRYHSEACNKAALTEDGLCICKDGQTDRTGR